MKFLCWRFGFHYQRALSHGGRPRRSGAGVFILSLLATSPAFGGLTEENGAVRRGATPITSIAEATNHCGAWIWDHETSDKQICHLWRQFEIPRGGDVLRAQLRITVDNAFTVYLDGRELGRGINWRTLNAYDLSWVLSPGTHVLAVDAFNEVDKAGVIAGLYAELADGRSVEVKSDTNWLIAPITEKSRMVRREIPAPTTC